MYVIRPFRAQGPRELAIALVIRTQGPWIAIIAAAVAIAVTARLWRNSRTLPRAAAVVTTVITIAFAAFTRVNVYEMMFHRIETPEAVPAKTAQLENDDMVLAINVSGHSRAYPVRMMGYHHIVNDRIGEAPIAATY
jgi:hypothetical protein